MGRIWIKCKRERGNPSLFCNSLFLRQQFVGLNSQPVPWWRRRKVRNAPPAHVCRRRSAALLLLSPQNPLTLGFCGDPGWATTSPRLQQPQPVPWLPSLKEAHSVSLG